MKFSIIILAMLVVVGCTKLEPQLYSDLTTANAYSTESDINAALTNRFNTMQPGEWFEKHNSISAEDFAKEPHRNKLNVIITRSVHQGYHLGQMAYLKSK